MEGRPIGRDRPQPRKPDEQRLYNRALFYLGRYAASEQHLAHVLRRRALREAAAHAIPAERVEAMIEAVLARLRALGYLDDRRYAAVKARSLADKGRSLARIRATLARQGLGRDTAEGAVATLREERADPELAAAVALARRRRLGPWRPEEERSAMRQRDLAALIRAGFTMSLAREVIGGSADELETRLAEA